MTKEQLRSYQSIKKEKAQLERLLEEIETPLYSAPGQQLTGMPHAPAATQSGSRQERLADRTAELRAWYRAKIDELHAEQLAIEKAIDGLEPTMRLLLRHRYIEGLPWEKVCLAINYGWAQTHRLHAAALQRLKDIDRG